MRQLTKEDIVHDVNMIYNDAKGLKQRLQRRTADRFYITDLVRIKRRTNSLLFKMGVDTALTREEKELQQPYQVFSRGELNERNKRV